MTRPPTFRIPQHLILGGLLAVALLAVAGGPALAADEDIVINEVFYLGATAAEDWIELKNTGTTTIDVSSWLFCARFSYNFGRMSALTLLDGDDLVMAPGEIITLQSWTNLNNTSSDLGLYTTTLFTSTDAMIDFVQWGTSADVGRTDVAFGKGIWTRVSLGVFDFVATAGAGESVAYNGTNSGGGLLTLSSDFTNGPPTRGQENGAPSPVEEATWGRVKSAFETD
jgi:hypothetical protein